MIGGHYSTERSGTERSRFLPHNWRANIALCVELLQLLVVVLVFMLEVTKKNVKKLY